jgi:hypothetical protein
MRGGGHGVVADGLDERGGDRVRAQAGVGRQHPLHGQIGAPRHAIEGRRDRASRQQGDTQAGNSKAARLAGLPVGKITFYSLVASGTISGFAGVLLLAQLRTASYDVGPPYLLPAFSAAFLGATQIKAGRVNVLGTLTAVYRWRPGWTGCS